MIEITKLEYKTTEVNATKDKRSAKIIFKDGLFVRCDYQGFNLKYDFKDWEFLYVVAVEIIKTHNNGLGGVRD